MAETDTRPLVLVIAITLLVGVFIGWIGVLVGPGATSLLGTLVVLVGAILVLALLAATWFSVHSRREEPA